MSSKDEYVWHEASPQQIEEEKEEANDEERMKDITIDDLETISKLGQGAYG